MSWNLGLYLTESFAEISANAKDQQKISKLWYLRAKSVVEGLKEFVSENKIEDCKINVLSTWPETIIKKSIGTAPALLVTDGFEHWPHLRQPKRLSWKLPPQRESAFFSSDYVFGLNERMSLHGDSRQAPNLEDLEFLDQKFKLMGIKNIAVGLLHSDKNAQHESMVGSFFTEKGYRVFMSHKYADNSNNEVARWWRAALEAYVVGTCEEVHKPLVEYCLEQKFQLKIHGNDFGSSFEMYDYLEQKFKNSGANFVLWADLKSFCLFDFSRRQKILETKWGPVAANTPRVKTLKIRATSLIENEVLKGQKGKFTDIGFEPGPMSLGRGVKPTFFDLLFALDLLDLPQGFESLFHSGAKGKITESLSIAMRVLLKNEMNWAEFLKGWFRAQLSSEIIEFTSQPRLLITGPLAPSLTKLLDSGTTILEHSLDMDHAFVASESVLGGANGFT